MKEAIANPDVWRKGGFKNAEASGLFSSATITRQYRAVYQGEAGSSPLR
jgi:hypothetical protein